jgi:hypothetical protein
MLLEHPSMTPRVLVTGASGNVGREVLRALLTLCAAILAAGCSCPEFPGVRGRVINQAGRPLQGAMVSADDGRAGMTSTDAAGVFDFPPTPLTQPSGETCIAHGVTASIAGCDTRSIDVGDGDVVLSCCPPYFRDVRGRLLDQGGNPIVTAVVHVRVDGLRGLPALSLDSEPPIAGQLEVHGPLDIAHRPNTFCGEERVIVTSPGCVDWSHSIPRGDGAFDLGDVHLVCSK